MRKHFLFYILLICQVLPALSQIEYGYERPKSSTDPWKFGVYGSATRDWVNQQAGIDKKTGYRVGLVAEKHLVYNLYFKPILSFTYKGFKYENAYKEGISSVSSDAYFRNDVNAYLLNLELTIEMKFGNAYKDRGFFLFFAPFFTQGIGGTSSYTRLNPNFPETYMVKQEYDTFGDNQVQKQDVGYVLGGGFDFNKYLQVNLFYTFGFINEGAYNNFRWRNFGASLVIFLE